MSLDRRNMSFQPKKLDKKRVKYIGRHMLSQPPGTKAAIGVDRGGEYEGKADWYVAQLKEKFPALKVEYVGALSAHVDVINVHAPSCSQN